MNLHMQHFLRTEPGTFELVVRILFCFLGCSVAQMGPFAFGRQVLLLFDIPSSMLSFPEMALEPLLLPPSSHRPDITFLFYLSVFRSTGFLLVLFGTIFSLPMFTDKSAYLFPCLLL